MDPDDDRPEPRLDLVTLFAGRPVNPCRRKPNPATGQYRPPTVPTPRRTRREDVARFDALMAEERAKALAFRAGRRGW